VTRAGDGASIDDSDGALYDGSSTDDEWFCRSKRRIAPKCRTTVGGAISLSASNVIPGTGRFARVALPGSQSDLAKIVRTTGEGTVVRYSARHRWCNYRRLALRPIRRQRGDALQYRRRLQRWYRRDRCDHRSGAISRLFPSQHVADAHFFTTANHICWSARATEIGNSSAITVYGPCLHLQTGCVQQGNVAGHAVAVLCNRSPTPSRLMPTEFIRVKNVPCNQPRTSAILSKF